MRKKAEKNGTKVPIIDKYKDFQEDIFMKKNNFFCVIISLFLIFNFSPVFADENSLEADSESEIVAESAESAETVSDNQEFSENDTDPILEGARETAKSFGNFLKRNADKLDKKIQSNRKNACEGKWIFHNGEAETTILCNSDGTMNVRMDKGDDIKLWKGSFESTKNEISFHITAYSERIGGQEKFDSLHSDDWKISYKVKETTEMTLISENMSADLNGYKFVNATVFLRVK